MQTLIDEFAAKIGTERYKLQNTPSSPEDVVIKLGRMGVHPTFYLDNNIQCVAFKNRSLRDIARTILHYFDISILEILTIIAKLAKEGHIFLYFCYQINNPICFIGFHENKNNCIANKERVFSDASSGLSATAEGKIIKEIWKQQFLEVKNNV